MNNKNTLLIFTRNPKLGKVKTRLAKTIGDKKALEIYIFLLEHTAKVTRDSNCEKKVYYSEEMAENDIWETPPFDKKLQMGSDLGIRMMNAFKDSFSIGYEKAIVIGSDLYDITEKHIEEAFSKLDTNDVVIGPAQDGGYYLLGMKKLYPEIFQQKKWGTNTVLRDTLEDLKTVDLALLEELNDVDVYDDIKDHAAFEKFLKK